MFRIHSRFEEGAFCEWHECQGCVPRFGLDEREAAATWLRGFLVDDAQVAALRESAHRAGDGLGLVGLGSQQVIDQVAWLISTGRVRVCGRGGDAASAVQEVMKTTDSPPRPAFDPVLPVRTPPRSRSAPPPSSPEDSTLPGAVDADAMADALLGAAADGTPFCEMCEKQRETAASAA